MDPISISPLISSVWRLIEPFVVMFGGDLLHKVGETLPDIAGRLWNTVKERMESSAETQSLPTDLVKHPEDEDIQGAFKYQLRKLVENDQTFAAQLELLVNEIRHVSTYQANLKGDGTIAQGENSIAIAKGGIHINGNVSGSNIITGDNNLINSEKGKNRRK